MQSHTRDLFVRGKAAAMAGEKEEARRYFDRLLTLDPPLQEKIDSYYWLSQIEDDPEKALDYVKEILVLDASEPRARRLLAQANGELKKEEIINPDQLDKKELFTEESQAIRFVCSRCGGQLKYDPELESVVCTYCNVITESKTQLTTSGNQVPENNFIATLATAKGHMQPVKVNVVECEGCGTALLISPGSMSDHCPYCASKYVVDMQTEKEVIIPNGIIPFQVPLKKAQYSATEWMYDFVDMDHVDVINPMLGIYIPGWTFDVLGTLPWEAEVENDDLFVLQEGIHAVNYNDYLIPGIVKTPSPMYAALRDFDLIDLKPFSEKYLIDYPAEIYQFPLADASLNVRQEILSAARDEIERENSHRIQNLRIQSTGMYIDAYRLVLLPIWMSQYTIKERQYRIIINGQTGGVYGDHPNNWMKESWISKFLGI